MRYLPLVLAVVALVSFTAYQGMVTDRWRDNVEADQCAKLLELIPKNIGDWVGEDQEVDELIRDTAGAEGYVSRVYRNKQTDEAVGVWFIVGHSFNIWRHTPNVCYRVQGFSQMNPNSETYVIEAEGQQPASFFTNVFSQGPVGGERVFWTWSKPVQEPGQSVEWIAPGNARGHFGNMRALYKLYFTTQVKSDGEKPSESVCVEFAQEFLPVANKILEQGVPSPATPAVAKVATPAAG